MKCCQNTYERDAVLKFRGFFPFSSFVLFHMQTDINIQAYCTSTKTKTQLSELLIIFNRQPVLISIVNFVMISLQSQFLKTTRPLSCLLNIEVLVVTHLSQILVDQLQLTSSSNQILNSAKKLPCITRHEKYAFQHVPSIT